MRKGLIEKNKNSSLSFGVLSLFPGFFRRFWPLRNSLRNSLCCAPPFSVMASSGPNESVDVEQFVAMTERLWWGSQSHGLELEIDEDIEHTLMSAHLWT